MNKPSLALASALLLLTVVPAQRPNRGPRREPKLEHYTYAEGTITSDKVHSGEAGYFLLLPKVADDEAHKDKKYPWVLWLPGFGGPFDFLYRGGAEVLDQLRGEGKIPEVALVVYRGPGRRSVYMNGEQQTDTEDLLTGDFLKQLQEQHPLASDPKLRAVMGCSAGGYGALHLAMRHPELFAAVAVHSAAILPGDPAELDGMMEGMVQRFVQGGLEKELGSPLDKAKWQAHMPLGLVVTKKPADLKGLQIYFDAGTEDHYDLCPPNETLDGVMKANGFKHTFVKVEGGGHAWSSPMMKDNLAVSMQYVGFALAGKDADAEIQKVLAKPAPEATKDAEKKDGDK